MASFHERVTELFEMHYPRLHRVLQRLSGDSDLAADYAQGAFVRLYERGSLPDAPEAWLVSVALNLLRNERTTHRRRLRLLSPARGEEVLADPPPAPDRSAEAEETRRRVRGALDRLSERERSLLVLHAEGYRYRDIAAVLGLHETSVGTLLARARRALRRSYEEGFDAP